MRTSGEDISNMEQHDGVVWRINIEEINSLLPIKYQEELHRERAYLFIIDMLAKLAEAYKLYYEIYFEKGDKVENTRYVGSDEY